MKLCSISVTDIIETKPEDLVNEKDVAIALRADKGSAATLKNFLVKGFTKLGDNYACVVSSVVVEYELSGKVHETSYVVKLNPRRGVVTEKVNSVLFDKEINFYQQAAPRLNSELANVGQGKLKVPKSYHSVGETNREVIYMEDLRRSGFKMTDRKKGMDKHHVNLILRELGRLHAASVILFTKNKLRGKAILEQFPYFEEAWTQIHDDNSETMNVGKMYGRGFASTADILEGIEGYEYAVEFLRSKVSSGKEMLQEMLETRECMQVLCHGDCWSNNFLFK